MAYTCLELTEFKPGFYLSQFMADLLREKIVPKKVVSITDHDNKTTMYKIKAYVICDENDR